MRDEDWERGSVPLKFQFGDVIFGSVTLSLFRRSAQIDEDPLDVGDTPDQPPRLDDSDGYVVWSQPVARRLPVLGLRREAIVYTPRQYRRFSIDLSGDFDHYMETFSAKTRSGLKRKLRKFADASAGVIDWKEYRTPEEIAAFFPLARSVSEKTYQERLLQAGLPADQSFIKSVMALAGRDRIRAYLLFLKSKPISYLFCPILERVVRYDHLGYDPAYSTLSPGIVLQMLALETLFRERRFELFDFTEGEGQHKELFSTGSCPCGDVYVVSRRLVPMSFVMLHHAADSTSATVGLILERLKIKSPLRRLLRGM